MALVAYWRPRVSGDLPLEFEVVCCGSEMCCNNREKTGGVESIDSTHRVYRFGILHFHRYSIRYVLNYIILLVLYEVGGVKKCWNLQC